MQLHRVDAPSCLVGEGPVWDPRGQSLYYFDAIGKKLHCYDPAAGDSRSWDMPEVIGAFALRESGGAVIALTSGVYALDLQTGGLKLLARPDAPHPREQFNDGKVDRRGRLVIGSGDTVFEGTQPVGSLYSLGLDAKFTVLDQGVNFSNSPCWSPDNKIFYFSDSLHNTMYAYDYDIETGNLANKRVFVNTSALGGLPDGATVDADGLVWTAIFKGGKVAAFRADGKLERVIDMPVSLIGSVMFGGPNLDQLYVTTIEPSFFGGAAEKTAGDLYRIDGLGTRGLPEPYYKG